MAAAALAGLFLLGPTTGCVSLPARGRVAGPEALTLDGVPVRAFGTDRCGAGALAAVLHFHGDSVTQEALDAALPKAAGGGVLSLDLMLAARDRGHAARLVPGSEEALISSVRSGLPAIVMLQVLDAPGGKRDLFHYVVVDGADPGRGLVRVHLGDGRTRWVRTSRLEQAWAKAGHALLEVMPRDPLDGGAHSHAPAPAPDLRTGVALEQEGRLEEAAAFYRAALASGPASALTWTNVGNVEAARGRTVEAEAAYRAALRVSPDDPDALNNLAWLLLEQGSRIEEAEGLARRATEAPSPDPHLAFDTLGRILLARGRCAEARTAFRRGLEALPPERAVERAAFEAALESAGRRCSEGGLS